MAFATATGIVAALALGIAVSLNLYIKEKTALRRAIEAEQEEVGSAQTGRSRLGSRSAGNCNTPKSARNSGTPVS